jgi:hypothetical protein
MTNSEIASLPDPPRPEHPRPDFHRGQVEGRDWVCLNGWWEFAFDPSRQGEEQGWPQGAGDFPHRLRVPFPWQSHLAWGTEKEASNDNWLSKQAYCDPSQVSLADRSYGDAPQYEVGWYRRRLVVPAAWRQQGKRVFLNVGAADWHITVWVNGHLVGDGDSGYLPVSFDLTDHLSPPEADNLLVIRVLDPMEHETQPVGKQHKWYTRTSGLWQPVWLEPRPSTHFTSLRLYPDLRTGLVRIVARLKAGEAGRRARLWGQVALAGQPLASAHVTWGDFAPGQHEAELVVQVHPVRPWSPQEPVLYDLTVGLQYNRCDGTPGGDEVHTYFGFREITVQPLYHGGPPYVHLNGRPVYLRGVLDQSFNPWGVYTFPTDEAIRRDLEQAKESGFNLVRLHIKLEDPRWYYWADRLGLLVIQDLPNFGYQGWSKAARERYEWTLRGALERDGNHPSIIAWCCFNETWGLGGQDYQRLPKRQLWVEQMYLLTKRLDPTRLVEDNSACLYDHVATDLNSWHFYLNDYQQAAEHLRQVVAQTYPGSGFNFVRGRYQRGEPLLNSEYGGISAGMGDMDVSWGFRFLTNELRRWEAICGYVYTELMDIEWERNGFYNYDRSPKEFGYNPRLLQGEQFVGVSGPPGREVAAGQPVGLHWWLRGPAPEGEARLIVRAQRFNCLAEMESDWRETIAVGNWALACLGEHELGLPAHLTAAPGLVWVWFELVGAQSRVLAGNFAVLEVTGPLPLPAGAQLVDLGSYLAAGPDPRALERGEYGGQVQVLSFPGEGWVEFAIAPPPGAHALTILAELSSRRPGPGVPQTDADVYPTEVAVRLEGQEIERLVIGNQYADARGALSHMHGFAGRYGQPVRVEVPPESLRRAKAAAGGAELRLCFEVPPDAAQPGGLTLYGPRAGRYPCGLTLLWHQ